MLRINSRRKISKGKASVRKIIPKLDLRLMEKKEKRILVRENVLAS